MGGEDALFRTAQWTRIVDARSASGDLQRRATGQIIRQYWKPVYFFLRRRGLDNDQAKDVTQGFFCDILLGRRLIQQADRTRGPFRSLLLTALERYVIGLHRSATAAKRTPPGTRVSLEGLDELSDGCLARSADVGPRDAFIYAWARELVWRVVQSVAESCRRDGLDRHWAVFEATVVRPALEGVACPSLESLCRALDIETPAKAGNMSVTVKRRFQAELRRNVRQYVDRDEQVDEEIRELMGVLAGRCSAAND